MSFGSLPSVLGNGGGVAISVIGGRGLFADGTAAAPSISFSSAPTNGIYYAGGNEVGISNNGILRWKSTYASATNHRFQANGGGYLDATSNGAIGLAAAGTNQNITLTPSGTGEVLIAGSAYGILRFVNSGGPFCGYNTTFDGFQIATGSTLRYIITNGGRHLFGTVVDSGALLQIGTNTTGSSGGMVFGTDTFLYRLGTSQIMAESGASGAIIGIAVSGTRKGYMYHNATDFFVDADAGIFNIRTMTANSIVLKTNNTTALTLDSSQNILTSSGGIFYTNRIYNLTGGATPLTIGWTGSAAILSLLSSGAATFAGAVTLGGALKLANAYVAGAVVGTGYVTIQDSTGTTYRVPVLV